jgi:hypothetical protein
LKVSRGSRRPHIAAALALIIAGVMLALMFAEVTLRLLGLGQQGMYQWDPDRGWALRDDAFEWQHREGNAFVRTNREGMRDREHTYTKPRDALRIAFIGDSFTEAEQVSIENNFVSIVERRLGNCSRLRGKHVETLNFGCDGYGTAQELATLKREVWKFSPDIVVLLFFAGNDIRNNSLSLEWHTCQPFYLLHGDEITLGGPFIDSPVFRTRCLIKFESRRSATLNVIGDSVERVRAVLKARKPSLSDHHPNAPAVAVELGLVDAIFRPPQSPEWESAWKVTEKLLLAINQEVTQHGAQFLTVTATTGPQVYPDPVWRHKYEKAMDVKDLYYSDFRIRDLGHRAGFPVLNLSPAFQAFADQNHVFLHGFDDTKLGTGHWN